MKETTTWEEFKASGGTWEEFVTASLDWYFELFKPNEKEERK